MTVASAAAAANGGSPASVPLSIDGPSLRSGEAGPAEELDPASSAARYQRPPAPIYPRESRLNRETGVLVMRVTVGTDGLVERVEVASSSGHERLDRAGLESVREVRFTPYVVEGRARRFSTTVPIFFKLEPGDYPARPPAAPRAATEAPAAP